MFRYLLYISVSLMLFSTSSWAQDQGKRYAILAGVEQYEHSKLTLLEYAEDDVTELGDILTKAGYSVTLLSDAAGKTDANRLPTKQSIETTLTNVLKQLKRHDTILICLTGHGLQTVGEKDSFFCPRDANPSEKNTLISLKDVYERLDKCGAGFKALFVDACRNDPDPGRGRSAGIDANTAPPPPRGIAAFFSCSGGERSFEHKDIKHGVFTYSLIQGLKGEAKDNDGDVTFESLVGYVKKNTPKLTQNLLNNQSKQSPEMHANGLSGVSTLISREALELIAIDDSDYLLGAQFDYGFQKQKINEVLAFEYYMKAAQRDHALASAEVAIAYFYGNQVKKDIETANRWALKARPKLELLSKKKHRHALWLLGMFYFEGITVSQDYTTAKAMFEINQDYALAQRSLGNMYEDGKGVVKNEMEAIKWYRRAAEQIPRAKCNLAHMYYEGKGVDKNLTTAFELFSQAAEAGGVCAQTNLGLMHARGERVKKDETEALRLFRQAAEQNYPEAQVWLGNMYQYGLGTQKDLSKALELYLKAADAGNANGQMCLGIMYERGEGVTENDVEAVKWLKKAAEQNIANAQYYLAFMYINATGVEKNTDEAIKLFQKAADVGNAQAQLGLGYMYDQGEGVPENDIEAVKWYRKAAEQGLQAAQNNLALCYVQGNGVTIDKTDARKWFEKALHNIEADANQIEIAKQGLAELDK
jgi:TPR repeat protein